MQTVFKHLLNCKEITLADDGTIVGVSHGGRVSCTISDDDRAQILFTRVSGREPLTTALKFSAVNLYNDALKLVQTCSHYVA